MKVRFVDTSDETQAIIQAVKDNEGYCPCRLEKTPENKCICAEFRAAPVGETCHCGLYYKMEE